MVAPFSVAPKRCRRYEGGWRRRRARRTPHALLGPLLLLLLWGGSSCSASDPLERLIEQLNEPQTREQAIDKLIKRISGTAAARRPAIQRRVVDALCEAYRTDVNRGEIVSALAFLKTSRAKHIFTAALRDAHRGGKYREAAIRSAQLLGELGLKEETPALLDALKRVRGAPASERSSSWLERAVITALIKLGDRRAVPSLNAILEASPDHQDVYLNKLAARALGQLGDERGIPPLIDALTRGAHGLLLFETSRRALCRIGPAAVQPLLARVTHRRRGPQHYTTAVAAIKLLGDLGHPGLVAALELNDQDDVEVRLALAESLLRFGERRGEEILLNMIKDEEQPLTARQRAAELIGWYGNAGATEPLLAGACGKDSPGQNVLCWGIALAHTRLANADGLAALDQLIATRTDQATQHYLNSYRPRLAMMERCGQDQACMEKHLTDEDWRLQERAALALGRIARQLPPADRARIGAHLAGAYGASHPQVREAILIGVERLDVPPETRAKMAELLRGAERASDPDIDSRALCLSRRLMRTPGEKR